MKRASRPAAIVCPDNSAALAAARELGSAGVRVYVLSWKPGPAARSRFAKYVKIANLYRDHRDWAEGIAEFAESLDLPPVLIATEDAALLALDRHHERLSQAVLMPYPMPGVVSRIVDKRLLYEAAERVHISTPGQREVRDAAELAGKRANGWLVKPAFRYKLTDKGVLSARQMLGGTKAVPGEPQPAAASVISAGFPALLQEAIPGGFETLVTAAVYLRRDGTIGDFYTARKQYEYPEPFGDGLVVHTVRDPGIVELTVRLLREVGYWGMCEVEFKRDRRDGRFKLLDANPRPWLWMNLGTRAGKHLLLAAYNTAAGQHVRARLSPPSPPSKQTTWVSGRGAMGFITKCYTPRRHGMTLPLRLILGVLRTSLQNLKTFRDPLSPLAHRMRRRRSAKSRSDQSMEMEIQHAE